MRKTMIEVLLFFAGIFFLCVVFHISVVKAETVNVQATAIFINTNKRVTCDYETHRWVYPKGSTLPSDGVCVKIKKEED